MPAAPASRTMVITKVAQAGHYHPDLRDVLTLIK
jgi:hypothetical protein